MIDIVLATRDRPSLLARTLEHIAERTHTPHLVHVVFDGEPADKDATLYALGPLVDRAHIRERQAGITATLRELLTLSESDPLVYTDDDVLCPLVAPDWLARLHHEMLLRPRLGILALNSPQNHPAVGGDRRRIYRRDGEITICRNVGGTFAAIRRAVLEGIAFPEGEPSPLKALCIRAGAAGWQVGYLTRTYCQHIGAVSVRNGVDMSAELALVAPAEDFAVMGYEVSAIGERGGRSLSNVIAVRRGR